MSRAIWEGSISFGLVQIPVGLYGAESRNELSFDLLDRRDMSPVGYQRINKSSGEVVDWGDIVKGYELASGEYVTVDKEDFERANVKASRTVDIIHFADAGELDVLYYEKPYYLVPDERGTKPYVLLREALRKQNKIGIARVVIRTREHLAAVIVRGDAMVLELLRWHDEIVEPTELELPPESAKVGTPELKMAERLIEEMTASFTPEEYKDTYHDDLLKLIHRKAKEGDKVYAEPLPEREEATTNVVDIMALLRQSLGDKESGGKAKSASKAAKLTNKTRASKTKNKKPAKKAAARSTHARRKTAGHKRGSSKRTAARKAS